MVRLGPGLGPQHLTVHIKISQGKEEGRKSKQEGSQLKEGEEGAKESERGRAGRLERETRRETSRLTGNASCY
jgi:hypothetical protein